MDGTAGMAAVAGVAAATGAGVADATVTGADILANYWTWSSKSVWNETVS